MKVKQVRTLHLQTCLKITQLSIITKEIHSSKTTNPIINLHKNGKCTITISYLLNTKAHPRQRPQLITSLAKVFVLTLKQEHSVSFSLFTCIVSHKWHWERGINLASINQKLQALHTLSKHSYQIIFPAWKWLNLQNNSNFCVILLIISNLMI